MGRGGKGKGKGKAEGKAKAEVEAEAEAEVDAEVEADVEAATGNSKRKRRRGGGGGGGGDKEFDQIEQKATELNDTVFPDKHIDNDAFNALLAMGLAKAMELLQELEEKADEIRNPSGFLKSAAKKMGFGPQGKGGGGGDGKSAGGGKSTGQGKSTGKGKTTHSGASDGINPKVRKRAESLNERLFADRPISVEAMGAMSALGVPSAMTLFKELEEMGGEVRQPSRWLASKAKGASSSLAVIAVAPKGDKGKGKGDKGDKGKSNGKGEKGKGKGDKSTGKGGKSATSDEDRIEKRAQFLNKSVFTDRPLDDDSMCALMGMGLATAMDIFLELEEKGDRMRNPSGYVKTAAKAMGLSPTEEQDAPRPRPKGNGKGPKGGGKGKHSAPQAIGGDPKKRPAPGDAPPGKRARRGKGLGKSG